MKLIRVWSNTQKIHDTPCVEARTVKYTIRNNIITFVDEDKVTHIIALGYAVIFEVD